MFYIIKVGAGIDCRFFTWGGEFSSWNNARTFFSREKAEETASKIDLELRTHQTRGLTVRVI
jgi:hypothetical protein